MGPHHRRSPLRPDSQRRRLHHRLLAVQPPDRQHQRLLDARPDSDGNQRGIQAHNPWGNGTIFFDQSGCCDPPERLTVGGQIQLNTWQHLAFRRDAAGNRSIWVDGTSVATAGGADPLDPFDGILTIGAEGPNGNNSFNGIIDEFAVFAGDLSDQEIMNLASGGSPADLLVDTDGDGMTDSYEDNNGLDKNVDDSAGDLDNDGLTNLEEFQGGTDPQDDDSDDDGLLDGVETKTGTYVDANDTGTDPRNADSDGDGLSDGVENNSGVFNSETDPGTDPNNPDTDGDELLDGAEFLVGANPLVPDTPGPPTSTSRTSTASPTAPPSWVTTPPSGATRETAPRSSPSNCGSAPKGWATPAPPSAFPPSCAPPWAGPPPSTSRSRTTGTARIRPTGSASLTAPFPPWIPMPGKRPRPATEKARRAGPTEVEQLAFEFDTWTNGVSEFGVGIAVSDGVSKTDPVVSNGAIVAEGTTVNGSATISWSPETGATFMTTGLALNADFEDVALPGFSGSDDFVFAFGARTGGAHEELTIDNLVITTGSGPRLPFDIESAGDDLVLTWESGEGQLFNLRSETDPSASDPIDWPIFDGHADLVATPPENTLTIPRPPEDKRFFVVEAFPAPPVAKFSDDFESGQGDWTSVRKVRRNGLATGRSHHRTWGRQQSHQLFRNQSGLRLRSQCQCLAADSGDRLDHRRRGHFALLPVPGHRGGLSISERFPCSTPRTTPSWPSLKPWSRASPPIGRKSASPFPPRVWVR